MDEGKTIRGLRNRRFTEISNYQQTRKDKLVGMMGSLAENPNYSSLFA
jgi:hypothetical protein